MIPFLHLLAITFCQLKTVESMSRQQTASETAALREQRFHFSTEECCLYPGCHWSIPLWSLQREHQLNFTIATSINEVLLSLDPKLCSKVLLLDGTSVHASMWLHQLRVTWKEWATRYNSGFLSALTNMTYFQIMGGQKHMEVFHEVWYHLGMLQRLTGCVSGSKKQK